MKTPRLHLDDVVVIYVRNLRGEMVSNTKEPCYAS
jgi:hypothetical protein